MKLRTALLGSTAALLTLSSAHALTIKKRPVGFAVSRPIVGLENEPTSPLHIASSYGPGYFYIPGTETALKLSGYISSDLSFGKDVNMRHFSSTANAVSSDYGYGAKGSLIVQTSTDTRYGPLTSYLEIRGVYQGSQGTAATSESVVSLHHAYFELGGLRIGADDSIFSYWPGYFGTVLNDNILNPMAYATTNAVSYTFNAGNGVSAIIGLEQGGKSPDLGHVAYHYADGVPEKIVIGGESQNKGKIPNIVAGIKYAQGWGAISAVAAYDTSYDTVAGKVRLDTKVNDRASLWVLAGYKSGKDAYITDGAPVVTDGRTIQPVYRALNSIYGDWGGSWEVVGGGSYKMTPAAVLNAQVGYDATSTFAASVDVAYALRKDLVFVPELTYVSWNNDLSKDATAKIADSLKGKSALQMLLHMKYSF